MRTLIVIPARMGSWRFPDKPLTPIMGMPMIEHVYRRSCLASNSDKVVIAIHNHMFITSELDEIESHSTFNKINDLCDIW